VLATPIFFPAVEKMGFDPYWFGAVIGVTIMIGRHSPVAINVFVVKNITKAPLGTIYRGILRSRSRSSLSACCSSCFPRSRRSSRIN